MSIPESGNSSQFNIFIKRVQINEMLYCYNLRKFELETVPINYVNKKIVKLRNVSEFYKLNTTRGVQQGGGWHGGGAHLSNLAPPL